MPPLVRMGGTLPGTRCRVHPDPRGRVRLPPEFPRSRRHRTGARGVEDRLEVAMELVKSGQLTKDQIQEYAAGCSRRSPMAGAPDVAVRPTQGRPVPGRFSTTQCARTGRTP